MSDTHDLHDAVTHREAWETIFNVAIEKAYDLADRSYYQHEKKALMRMLDDITRPQPAVTVKPLDAEQAAKNVYLGMIWACNAGGGAPPVWVEGGNSHGQVEARSIAARILSAIQPAPTTVRADALREAAAAITHHGSRNDVYSKSRVDAAKVILALIDTPAHSSGKP